MIFQSSKTKIPKKRLYVHIGTHKTGTTSLQYFLHANMQRLYDRDFLYPSTGRHPRSHVQHALIARALKEPRPDVVSAGFALKTPIDSKLLLDAVLHEIELSGRNNIILSSEEFSTMNDDEVQSFFIKFDSFYIIPIIYIRDSSDMAQSLYQTYVTHESITCDFTEFELEKKARTDLFSLCNVWSQRAFNNKIIIRSYDCVKNNVVIDFLRIVDLEAHHFDMSMALQRLNETLPPYLVCVMRELRKQQIQEGHISSLIDQLKILKIDEKQTNIPENIRINLKKRYRHEIKLLSSAKFIDSRFPLTFEDANNEEKVPVFIDDLVGAIFSIGRSVARSMPAS